MTGARTSLAVLALAVLGGCGQSAPISLLLVPLVVKPPGGARAGRVVGAPVELVDIAPTALELLGLALDRSFQGRSVAGLIAGGTTAQQLHQAVFMERRLVSARALARWGIAGEQHAVRRGRWKYIVAPEQGATELYDLRTDPDERSNLAIARQDICREMQAELISWKEKVPPALISTDEPRISSEDAAALRALGYVD